MAKVARKQANLVRGVSKKVFAQDKYCCVGAKPRRNASGVQSGHYKMCHGDVEDWDCIVNAVKWCEHAFCSFAGTEVIACICEARNAVQWETINFSEDDVGSEAKIFNGVAFE